MIPIHRRKLDLNLSQLKHNCNFVYKQIIDEIAIPNQEIDTKHTSIPTAVSQYYNLFTSIMPGMFELKRDIRNEFKNNIPHDESLEYWIVGWLNYWPKQGTTLTWHGHEYGDDDNCFHGYLGVQCEPSQTIYRNIGEEALEIAVENKNGQLVITNSKGVEHMTSDWKQDDPRITIAFNIQPRETVLQEVGNKLNYYVGL